MCWAIHHHTCNSTFCICLVKHTVNWQQLVRDGSKKQGTCCYGYPLFNKTCTLTVVKLLNNMCFMILIDHSQPIEERKKEKEQQIVVISDIWMCGRMSHLRREHWENEREKHLPPRRRFKAFMETMFCMFSLMFLSQFVGSLRRSADGEAIHSAHWELSVCTF